MLDNTDLMRLEHQTDKIVDKLSEMNQRGQITIKVLAIICRLLVYIAGILYMMAVFRFGASSPGLHDKSTTDLNAMANEIKNLGELVESSDEI